MSNTPFPLGVYVGDPNGSDASAEATFEANYSAFSTLLGAQPQFLDVYTDQTQSISQWVSNASWEAWSMAQSVDTHNMTPVIGLPMTSTANGSESADQFYKYFAGGTYDSVLQGMVQAWAAQGFTTQYWRPGWEMNLASMPSYAGSDAATRADWVAAFQHISTVLHAAGAADGVNVQVMWNPSITNYSLAGDATQTLYPGSHYVDVIGADVYGDLYPYGNQSALYDWDKSGQVLNSANPVYDSSIQQWASDSANLMHYYTDPAATQWAADGSDGHSLSLQELIDFAKTQGKPIAIAETGSGSTSDGAGVADNPTFVQWLSNTLQNAGVPVTFVNIWDSNGGSNYEFSSPSDGKPLEAAAWAQYFGAQATITLGSGSDTIALSMSEDAYQGDAQFTVSVDGVQVGGMQTITASHAAGQSQTVNVEGNWGAGQHTVSIDFLNDLYAGSSSTDRNLYVSGASFDGTAAANATLNLMNSGTQFLTVGSGNPSAITLGSGVDAISLSMSEDAYQGDAQFTISVDGTQVGGTQTITASHAAGQAQTVNVEGNWGAGQHTVAIDFLNDLYAGSSSTDRNLYVGGASFDGTAAANATLNLMNNGTQFLTVGSGNPSAITVGSGSDTIALSMSEDAYQGDAQFTVSVDGTQVGGTQTVTASHAAGQTINVEGNWGPGQHTVAIDFLNDLYGGSSATDRNLYVNSATIDGTAVTDAQLSLYTSGTQSFTAVTSTTYSPGAAGGNITTLGNDTVQIGSGAVTVNASGPSVSVTGGSGAMTFVANQGTATIMAASGPSTITGGSGALTFTEGSGAATVTAGTGKEIFNFVNGTAGGSLTVNDFTSGTDILHLQGYQGSGITSEQISGGSTQIVLSDNTRISLLGFAVSSTDPVFG
jgi:Ca-dependent carbohydrate-binding module xylan-binding